MIEPSRYGARNAAFDGIIAVTGGDAKRALQSAGPQSRTGLNLIRRLGGEMIGSTKRFERPVAL
jgi:hypothetical protein